MNDISPINIGVNTRDLTQAVRESAMLADVSLSMWEASQNDKALMEGVKRQHGAHGDVGKVIKYLMAGADSRLKSTRNAFKAVREHHRKLTLQWISDPHSIRADGPRLLPHLLNPRYMTEVSQKKREAEAERDEFVHEYPDLIIQAKANLGSMVSDSDYPTADQIKHMFRCHFDFEPLPVTTEFRGLPEHTIERLSAGLLRKQQRQIQQAEAEMWSRVKAHVSHMVERLSVEEDESKIFKAATVENVREMLTLLPGWNVTGNPQVQEITQQLEAILDGVDADSLRRNKKLRAATAKETKQVIDKLTRWGL